MIDSANKTILPPCLPAEWIWCYYYYGSAQNRLPLHISRHYRFCSLLDNSVGHVCVDPPYYLSKSSSH
jgi:hypothetical protein